MKRLLDTARSGLWVLLWLAAGCSEAPLPFAIGAEAPAFDLPDLRGERVASAAFRGRPTVLAFWATWCLPCLEEIPLLNSIAATGEVNVVAISLDQGGADLVRRFTEERGLEYTVLLGNEELFRRYDGLTIPQTVALDSQWGVVASYRGRIEPDRLWQDLGLPSPTPTVASRPREGLGE